MDKPRHCVYKDESLRLRRAGLQRRSLAQSSVDQSLVPKGLGTTKPGQIQAGSYRQLSIDLFISHRSFTQAAFDFSEALKIQPSSKELQNLLEQAIKKYEDAEGSPFDMKSLSRTEQSPAVTEIVAPVEEQPVASQSEDTPVSLTFHCVQDKRDLLLPHEHFSLVCQGHVDTESSEDSLPSSTDTFVRIQIIEEDDEDDE